MCLNVGLAVHSDTKTRECYACRLVQALNATEHPQRIDGYGIRGGKLWLVVTPLWPLGILYAWQRIRMHVQCGKPIQTCYGQPKSFRVKSPASGQGAKPPSTPHNVLSDAAGAAVENLLCARCIPQHWWHQVAHCVGCTGGRHLAPSMRVCAA